jgi:hypothetical protein
MRNRWYPIGVARYAIGDELKDINAGKINVERDSEFEAGRYKAQLAAERKRQTKEAIEVAKKAARAQKLATAAAKKAVTVQQLSVCAMLQLEIKNNH